MTLILQAIKSLFRKVENRISETAVKISSLSKELTDVKNTANKANGDAINAQTMAETAKTMAEQAQTTADNAQNTAETAKNSVMPIFTTTGDGYNYTGTCDAIKEYKIGMLVSIIVHTTPEMSQPWLNINKLGSRRLYLTTSTERGDVYTGAQLFRPFSAGDVLLLQYTEEGWHICNHIISYIGCYVCDCTTAADVGQKIVPYDDHFNYDKGGVIYVKFKKGNSVGLSQMTLAIGSKKFQVVGQTSNAIQINKYSAFIIHNGTAIHIT